MHNIKKKIHPAETPIFFLSGNPFVCDCHLQWLKRINVRAGTDADFPRVPDLDRVRCAVPDEGAADPGAAAASQGPRAPGEERAVARVRDEHFLCPYEKRCLPQCRCCDFLACDCQSKCPPGCRCFRDQNWTENVVRCSAGGFDRVPEVVPMDATALHLDGNNLTELAPGILVGRNRLRRLSLVDSQVARIANQTFGGLASLQVLRLGHNKLKNLHGYEFLGLESLRELHLNHNQLVSMSPDVFRPLRHLAVLRLDGNLLISFPVWQLSSNPALQTLALSDNWWQCDCDFVRKFRMFIDGNADIIPDAADIRCTSPSDDSDLNDCSGFLSGSIGSVGVVSGFGGAGAGGDFSSSAVALAAVAAVVSVAVAVVVSVLLRTRESILVWLHHKHGVRIGCGSKRKKEEEKADRTTDGEDEEGNLFDALVIYSAKDDSFVRGELARQLESTRHRLCLLHRDLSGIYTSEAFKSAQRASARCILVFSQAFFSGGGGGGGGEWEYVRELGLRAKDCVVVLAPDLDGSQEEVAEKAAAAAELMRRARRTLAWGEGRFWRRLRFHLPDPTRSSGRKEGGAELDVSGAWTFTNMEGGGGAGGAAANVNVISSDISLNNASTARLLTGSPFQQRNGGGGVAASDPSSSTASTPMLLSSNNPPSFKRKQPHQCSTHYLAGAPSSARTSSSLASPILAGSQQQHQRSVSSGHLLHPHPPSTRSRGISTVSAADSDGGSNVVLNIHQRSVSLVNSGGKKKGILPQQQQHHQRSSSSNARATAGEGDGGVLLLDIPPTPPPKQRLHNSFYNQQQQLPQQQQQHPLYRKFPPPPPPHQVAAAPPECLYSSPQPPSILRRLVGTASAGVGVPAGVGAELLQRLPPVGQAAEPTQPAEFSSPLARIPLGRVSPFCGEQGRHQRTSSLLDCAQRKDGIYYPVNRHGRSVSSLAQQQQQQQQQQHRRSSSGIARTASMLMPSTSSSSSSTPYKSSLFPPVANGGGGGGGSPAAQLHRSALDLMAREELLKTTTKAAEAAAVNGHHQGCHHARSKSTPFHGFVL